MLVRFWGTRGSLPAPLGNRAVRAKLRQAFWAARGHKLDTKEAIDHFIETDLPFSIAGTYGGNSSCVELVTGGEASLLCDLGTGVREFGLRMMAEHGPGKTRRYNVFLSHLHWDHIMGFPFFVPAYIPGNVIRIHGCHKPLREAFERQQSDPCFPVQLAKLGATLEFVPLEPGRDYEIDGVTVRAMLQNHAGDSYAYRFASHGKTVVYSTDNEHKFGVLDESYPFVGFYRGADLLIFDAMYSLADAISVKEDWGHSSNMVAVELAHLAEVKQVVLYHHEPVYDDRMIEQILEETRRYEQISRKGHALAVTSAYDGLEITV